METLERIETTLRDALARAAADGAPPRLAAAMRHALFPGGARVRPQLCLAIAGACGDDRPQLSAAAAAAIELMHSASLVHDDLPCFDDAPTRRGRPSVHARHGTPLALLAGDALIVAAFEVLATAAVAAPERLGSLTAALARATGMPAGIVAGQGWESEERIALDAYHRAKTGALFVAAARMGALAAGADPEAWRPLGQRLGDAYQVADDLADAFATAGETGKPAGQDALHGRPNAVDALGPAGAIARLNDLLEAAVEAIPPCPGRADLAALVRLQARRLTPAALAASAA